MRYWLPALVLVSFSLRQEPGAESEHTAHDATSPSVAMAARPAGPGWPGLQLWRSLDPSPPWRDDAAPEQPNPVVHCVGARSGDAFLRSSECARRGGHPDEPLWARSDPSD